MKPCMVLHSNGVGAGEGIREQGTAEGKGCITLLGMVGTGRPRVFSIIYRGTGGLGLCSFRHGVRIQSIISGLLSGFRSNPMSGHRVWALHVIALGGKSSAPVPLLSKQLEEGTSDIKPVDPYHHSTISLNVSLSESSTYQSTLFQPVPEHFGSFQLLFTVSSRTFHPEDQTAFSFALSVPRSLSRLLRHVYLPSKAIAGEPRRLPTAKCQWRGRGQGI